MGLGRILSQLIGFFINFLFIEEQTGYCTLLGVIKGNNIVVVKEWRKSKHCWLQRMLQKFLGLDPVSV